tara:strand:- start:254 stop:484 length:231 start_codon:yes stop_codon:yes gene_type:complete
MKKWGARLVLTALHHPCVVEVMSAGIGPEMTKLWHSCDFAFSGTPYGFRYGPVGITASEIRIITLAKPATSGNHGQ